MGIEARIELSPKTSHRMIEDMGGRGHHYVVFLDESGEELAISHGDDAYAQHRPKVGRLLIMTHAQVKALWAERAAAEAEEVERRVGALSGEVTEEDAEALPGLMSPDEAHAKVLEFARTALGDWQLRYPVEQGEPHRFTAVEVLELAPRVLVIKLYLGVRQKQTASCQDVRSLLDELQTTLDTAWSVPAQRKRLLERTGIAKGGLFRGERSKAADAINIILVRALAQQFAAHQAGVELMASRPWGAEEQGGGDDVDDN